MSLPKLNHPRITTTIFLGNYRCRFHSCKLSASVKSEQLSIALEKSNVSVKQCLNLSRNVVIDHLQTISSTRKVILYLFRDRYACFNITRRFPKKINLWTRRWTPSITCHSAYFLLLALHPFQMLCAEGGQLQQPQPLALQEH